MDDLLAVHMLNTLESLQNLNYLIGVDAENAEVVRSYLLQSERLLRRLVASVRRHHTEQP